QDRGGREMLISCGAALFGLRLAVRGLGYLPAVSLVSEPSKPWLLARVALGPEAPVTEAERRMLAALPHRHTHRGAFGPGPTPAGPGRRAQRDSDLGRHCGLLPASGPDEPPPAATAVLVTAGDSRLDWLRAGQALHRVLAHAATVWVTASLQTQPLEIPVIRNLIHPR